MGGLLKAVGQVSTMWSLAAFTIAAIMFFATARRGSRSGVAKATMVAVVLVGLLPIAGSLYVQLETEKMKQLANAMYRVRTIVLGPDSVPSNDAKVTSSNGGEPKRVAGGWEFDIPSQARPADGKLTIYAEIPAAFLKGKTEIVLGEDRAPTVTVQLTRDDSARVRGIILDESQRAVKGARVTVVGFGTESETTQSDGGFDLPAHVASGMQVQVHVEKERVATNQWVTAGNSSNTIILTRK